MYAAQATTQTVTIDDITYWKYHVHSITMPAGKVKGHIRVKTETFLLSYMAKTEF